MTDDIQRFDSLSIMDGKVNNNQIFDPQPLNINQEIKLFFVVNFKIFGQTGTTSSHPHFPVKMYLKITLNCFRK